MKIVLTVDVPDSDPTTGDEFVTPLIEAAAEEIRRHLIAQNVWANIDVQVEDTRVRF